MFNFFKKTLATFGLLEKVRSTYIYHDLAVSFNNNLKIIFSKEKKFYSQFISNNDLCFDIGANIGGKTYVFSKIGTQVIAVEPDPRAFASLKARFGKKKNITLLNCGLGEREETKELIEFSISTLSTFDRIDAEAQIHDSRLSGNSVVTTTQMRINTLDQLISRFGLPSYIKIAVVGYEVYVLKGLSRAPKTISFTMNSPYHIEKSLLCIKIISGLGIYKFNYCNLPLTGFILNEWIDSERIKEIICSIGKEIGTSYFEIFAQLN